MPSASCVTCDGPTYADYSERFCEACDQPEFDCNCNTDAPPPEAVWIDRVWCPKPPPKPKPVYPPCHYCRKPLDFNLYPRSGCPCIVYDG